MCPEFIHLYKSQQMGHISDTWSGHTCRIPSLKVMLTMKSIRNTVKVAITVTIKNTDT
jgi:hypothetical protein